MAMNLPLSDRQARALEDVLSTCTMTAAQEELLVPALKRLRQNIQYVAKRPTTLDHYYERTT